MRPNSILRLLTKYEVDFRDSTGLFELLVSIIRDCLVNPKNETNRTRYNMW